METTIITVISLETNYMEIQMSSFNKWVQGYEFILASVCVHAAQIITSATMLKCFP